MPSGITTIGVLLRLLLSLLRPISTLESDKNRSGYWNSTGGSGRQWWRTWGSGVEELHGRLLRPFMLTIIMEGPRAVGGYVWTIGLFFVRLKNYFVVCTIIIKRIIGRIAFSCQAVDSLSNWNLINIAWTTNKMNLILIGTLLCILSFRNPGHSFLRTKLILNSYQTLSSSSCRYYVSWNVLSLFLVSLGDISGQTVKFNERIKNKTDGSDNSEVRVF